MYCALRLATRGHRRGPRGRFGLPDGKVRVSEAVSRVNGADRGDWDNNSEYRRAWQAVRARWTGPNLYSPQRMPFLQEQQQILRTSDAGAWRRIKGPPGESNYVN